MPLHTGLNVKVERFLHRRTLILGEVNSGKTRRTGGILTAFIAAGLGQEVAVLDLAPRAVNQVGGKMHAADRPPLLYLTGAIVAPRLTAKTRREAEVLAGRNARLIDNLFDRFSASGRRIVFINDVTLYLQAGPFSRLERLLQSPHTAVINAYYGDSFAASPLTRRERGATDRLRSLCHSIIQL